MITLKSVEAGTDNQRTQRPQAERTVLRLLLWPRNYVRQGLNLRHGSLLLEYRRVDNNSKSWSLTVHGHLPPRRPEIHRYPLNLQL